MENQSKLESLREQYEQITRAYAEAVRNGESSNGIAALGRLKLSVTNALHDELARLEALDKTLTGDDSRTDEELIADAVVGLCAMPDPMLDRILSGVAENRPANIDRVKNPRLRVVK